MKEPAGASVRSRQSLKTRTTLVMLVVLLTGLWSLTFFISFSLRADLQQVIGAQQLSTVDLVAHEIDQELRARIEALRTVAASAVTIAHRGGALQALLEQRPTLQQLFNGGVIAYDTQGTAIADVPLAAGRLGVNYMDVDVVAAALKEDKAVIGRPVLGKKLRMPVFGIGMPLRDGQARVVGALAGVVNLGLPNFISRLIADNRHGRSGGFLLIDPQQRLVVAATDKSRIMEALAAAGSDPATDRLIGGTEGTIILRNPAGNEMLASVKRIPVTGWYLAAVLPTAEAFAPAREMQLRMAVATAFLSLLGCALTWWLLDRQLAPLSEAAARLTAMRASGEPLQALPIRRQDEIGALIESFNAATAAIERQDAELRANAEHLRIAAVAFESQQAMIVTDAHEVILKVNQAFVDGTGYAPEEAIGKTPRLLKSGRHNADFYREMWQSIRDRGGWQGEVWDRRKDGRIYPKWLNISAVKDAAGRVTHYIGTHFDITERKRAEERIAELAYFDQLTGLPNRTLLQDRLKQAMTAAARSGRYGALFFIDLDNFKTLNDTLGHDMGDALLKQVAQRLTGCVRGEDTVARLGGDEFIVMLPNLGASENEAAAHTEVVGDKMLATLNQPYQLADAVHMSTPSIGATLFQGGDSIDELMKQADLAMYKAKASGRNAVRFFDPAMENAVVQRVALERDLRAGIEQGQLLLHYQPQIAEGGRITGVEALVRWRHPGRGLVAPADFIPLAEETGLILPLGRWVLESACAQLAAWSAQPAFAALTVAVNVSVREFREKDFVAQVLSALRRSGADPRRLELELTESLLVEQVDDSSAKMSALKAHGIRFALDDFGTGYSSLAYLKRLPFDQLKIDRSFVRDLLGDPSDAAIARSIVALAHSLGLGVIAEGVETEAQRDFLAGLGCHACQGYLIGRPLPVDQLEALLRRAL